jgi:hypothetical protein
MTENILISISCMFNTGIQLNWLQEKKYEYRTLDSGKI